MRVLAAAFALGLAPWLVVIVVVLSHHMIYLPLVPNTPIMQHAITGNEITYCLNPRAESYPNFAAQVEDVTDSYRNLGFKLEKVAHGSGCELKHEMNDFSCGGCAAHVYYANWPVLIEYRYVLAYSDWRSAIGHEMGHALLGLHERYIDSGSIQCGGPERGQTVMDCGFPHVKYPQPLDVERWCGLQPVGDSLVFGPVCAPEPPEPSCDLHPPNSDGLRYDPCNDWFVSSGGNLYLLDAGRPPFWLWGSCSSWDGRHNNLEGYWAHGGAELTPRYLDALGEWSSVIGFGTAKVPPC